MPLSSAERLTGNDLQTSLALSDGDEPPPLVGSTDELPSEADTVDDPPLLPQADRPAVSVKANTAKRRVFRGACSEVMDGMHGPSGDSDRDWRAKGLDDAFALRTRMMLGHDVL